MSSLFLASENHDNLRSLGSDLSILAVDSATQACTVAICQGRRLVAESTNVTRQTHSRHLLYMINSTLHLANLKLAEVDGFVVTRGPGSFTGLRIGISTVKGLAQAMGKPLIGVSYLEGLALQSGVTNGLVASLLDARRGEFYYAVYRMDGADIETVIPESVGSIECLIQQINEPCLFIGNGVEASRQLLSAQLKKRASFAPACNHILKGSTEVYLGLNRLRLNGWDDLELVTPNYIRKSDAQINLEKKRQTGVSEERSAS